MNQHKSYVDVTDQSFEREVLESDTPALVDVWAPWCGPCRILGPVVEQLAAEYQGRVKVAKLNVDENPLTARRYGIRGIPTVLFFDRGQLVDQSVGLAPKAALAAKLDSLARAA